MPFAPIEPPFNEGEAELLEITDIGEVRPQIKSTDDEVVFEPAVVTRMNGILPWEVNRDKNLCGENRVSNSGDMNFRVTIEGVVFHSQLSTIDELRQHGPEVTVLTEMTRELGTTTTSFDRIEIERTADVSQGNTTFEGDPVTEALYTFQFQSKEQQDSS